MMPHIDEIPVDPAKLASGREVRAQYESYVRRLYKAAHNLLVTPETRAQARKYLVYARGVLKDTDWGLHTCRGIYGQRAAGIEDVLRRAGAYETAPDATLDGLPISVGEAMALRSLAA